MVQQTNCPTKPYPANQPTNQQAFKTDYEEQKVTSTISSCLLGEQGLGIKGGGGLGDRGLGGGGGWGVIGGMTEMRKGQIKCLALHTYIHVRVIVCETSNGIGNK
jgi:hypothetical protein